MVVTALKSVLFERISERIRCFKVRILVIYINDDGVPIVVHICICRIYFYIIHES